MNTSNACAVAMGAISTAGSGAICLLGQLPAPTISDSTAKQALVSMIITGIAGIVTSVVSAVLATRRYRIDAEERAAIRAATGEARFNEIEAKANLRVSDALKLVIAAKDEQDDKNAAYEAKIDDLTAKLEAAEHDRVLLHQQNRDSIADREAIHQKIEVAAHGIDATTAAVVKIAEATSVEIEPAPKMNGGSGAMDGVKP